MILLSIIIPVYNTKLYLNDCIERVLSQNYSKFECILIDDGSTDGSSSICDEYELKDSRITVKHLQHQGVSYARNIGLDMAKGKYIIFIDSDDVIELNMFTILMNQIIENDLDIVECGYNYIFEDGTVEKHFSNNTNLFTGKDVLLNFGCENSEIHHVLWNKVYKKDLFQNIRFPIGRVHEDAYVIYKLFYYAKNVRLITSCLYNYIKREGSITNTYNLNRLVSFMELSDEQIGFFLRNEEQPILNQILKLYYYMFFVNYSLSVKSNIDHKYIKRLIFQAFRHYKKYLTINDISLKEKLTKLIILCKISLRFKFN